jgi:ribosome maturation factor RimP
VKKEGYTPLFYCIQLKLVEIISEKVQEKLEGTPYFLVQAKIGAGNKIMLLLDGDKGIDIDFCAQVNRFLGDYIEEHQLITTAYTIEVGSCGVDEPLIYYRQYPKHIGRTMWVLMNDGKEVKGKITSAANERISIFQVKGKGKSKTEETVEIPFSDIKKAKIVLEF